MKIHNISNKSNNPISANIHLRNSKGIDNPITLNPGEIVYGEVSMLNNNLRIYMKKGILSIVENETKPDSLEFYKIYDSSKDISSKSDNKKDSTPEVKIEVKVEVNEEVKPKKKGRGRPAGSKDKSKRKIKTLSSKEEISKEKELEVKIESSDDFQNSIDKARENVEKYISKEDEINEQDAE